MKDHLNNSKQITPSLPKELRQLLAGGFAGMVAKSFVAPFERIKILFQVSSTKFCWYDVPILAKHIIKTEGFGALWKGHTATIIRIFPYAGIQFMVFDSIKSHFVMNQQQQQQQQHKQQQQQQHHNNNKNKNHYPSLMIQSHDTTNNTMIQQTQITTRDEKVTTKFEFTPFQSLIAGMMAGATSVICTYPLDLTRVQLATQGANSKKGFITVLTDNVKSRGFVGLFRGLTPTLLGIMPYAGIAFSLNEQGKQKIRAVSNHDLTTVEKMQCGAVAGLIAQTAAYPFETTRRRMQALGMVSTSTTNSLLEGGGVALANTPRNALVSTTAATPPMNMTSIVRLLYKEQGFRGFFKGVSMNWIKGPLATSISFTTFDAVKGWMETIQHSDVVIPPQKETVFVFGGTGKQTQSS